MKAFLDRVNPWMALITNIGVLLGVILLLVELQQNTTAIKSQTEYANISEWIALSREYALSPDLVEIVLRGNEGLENLTPEEHARYFHYLSTYIMITEISFNSINDNTFEYDEVANRRFILQTFSSPGARAYWEATKNSYTERFRAYMDEVLAEGDAEAAE
jgi:hypothetical protein